MSPELISLLLTWFVVFVFSTTLHEAAHAFAALRLGDPTAYQGGQVSLNPVPHVRREPFGMVVVPILSFVVMGGQWMIGWASAPYNPYWARKHPRKSAVMAAAGPLANLSLVIVSGVALKLGLMTGFFSRPDYVGFSEIVAGAGGAAPLATFLSVAFSLNLVLFVFNLLPLPPLDGSSVVQLLMTDKVARGYQELTSNPMWGWIGILVAWRYFGEVFGPVFGAAFRLLYS